jgi:hypothetical protein
MAGRKGEIKYETETFRPNTIYDSNDKFFNNYKTNIIMLFRF